MWKNIMALSFFVLSVGISYHLIQSAHANLGPQISYGSNPIVNFGGSIPLDGFITTAPSDQDIIITTMLTTGYCGVAIDGVNIIPTQAYWSPGYIYVRQQYDGMSSAFTQGNAKLKVPAGTTLSLTGCNGDKYYMDGYLSRP